MRAARRSRGRRPPIAKEGDDENSWMALYNDLVSILLGFFVLLYAASVVDQVKYKKVTESLAESLGGRPIQLSVVDEVGFDFNEVLRLLVKHIEQSELAEYIVLSQTPRGIELSTDSELMFESAQADLSPSARRFLHNLALLLNRYACNIIVEGHTDPLPISSKLYPSNWELSSARASSVVRFLIDEGIAAERLMAVGRADTKPFRPSGDALGKQQQRQRDRRVVLLLTPRNEDLTESVNQSDAPLPRP